MKTLLVVLCTLCAFSGLALGQSDDHKKGEFFVGASIVGLDDGTSDRRGLKGFEAAGVYNFSRYFGIKGDFSAAFDSAGRSFILAPSNTVSFDSHRRLMNYLGGIQVKDNANKGLFKPFAHALIGAGQNHTRNDNFSCTGSCTGFVSSSTSKTGFAAALGGGLDLRLNNRVQIRAFQIDYNPVTDIFNTQHNIRLSAGIVF